MICQNCQTPNPDSARFCRNCGQAFNITCANCGTSLAPGDRFCSACGQPTGTMTPSDNDRLQHLNTLAPTTLVSKIRTAEVTSDRKIVTALFVDVVGSTTLGEQMDAEEWTSIMNRAFELFSPTIYRYEGTVARLLGDAVLAFFGAPITHEDDPVRAIRATLEILEGGGRYAGEGGRQEGIEFAIRVGINTGPVVVGNVGSDLKYEDTAMGDAVKLAAGMQSAARPMWMLISQYTHRFVAPFFDFSDLGLIDVKGKSEPVHAYEVTGLKAEPSRARGLVGLDSPMVGRDAELRSLQQLLAVVQATNGRAAVILGEPGLGKSRLLSEWKATSQSVRWAEGQCVSYGKDVPYHLILSMLHSLLSVPTVAIQEDIQTALQTVLDDLLGDRAAEVYPYLAHILSLRLESALAERIAGFDPQSLQNQYVMAFRELLHALTARESLVLVLEDVYWADPTSVEMLTKLLPLAFHTKLLFCFVLRAERDVPGWKLISAAHELLGESLLEIRLQPLTETASQQLLSN